VGDEVKSDSHIETLNVMEGVTINRYMLQLAGEKYIIVPWTDLKPVLLFLKHAGLEGVR
jgi:hypothetical protein